MKIISRIFILLFFCNLFCIKQIKAKKQPNYNSSEIEVHLDDKKQKFNGAGASFGLYYGQWMKLSSEDKDKVARLIAHDINLTYIKTYLNDYYSKQPGKYDSFAEFYKTLIKYNKDIKVQICLNDLPDAIEQKDTAKKHKKHAKGETLKSFYDPSIPNIYQKIADYYFDVLKTFKLKGIEVDDLDLLNEPGNVNNAIFQGQKFAIVIPLLRNMINDINVNKYGIVMPKIAGVSLWGVAGTIKWFDEWKKNLPQAYKELNIVTTHGYSGGWLESNYQAIRNYIGKEKIFMNNEQTGKLKKGDGLFEQFKVNENDSKEPNYIGDVSIAMRISDAVNGGVNNFFIFQTNNPTGNNASLLKITNGTNSEIKKSAVYSGFKQLTSYQPRNSFCLGRKLSNIDNNRVLCFRKDDDAYLYVHIVNITNKLETYNLSIKNINKTVKMETIQKVISDENKDEFAEPTITFKNPIDIYNFNITPYSVNSFKIKLSNY